MGSIYDLANIPSAVNFENKFYFSATKSDAESDPLDTELAIEFEDPA